MLDIPDHDGRRLTPEQRRELDQLLSDADFVWGGSDRRRFVRALICFNAGDAAGFWREFRAGAYEAQSERGMGEAEFMRRTMPGRRFLSGLRPPEN